MTKYLFEFTITQYGWHWRLKLLKLIFKHFYLSGFCKSNIHVPWDNIYMIGYFSFNLPMIENKIALTPVTFELIFRAFLLVRSF